jgi:hypothetical protein
MGPAAQIFHNRTAKSSASRRIARLPCVLPMAVRKPPAARTSQTEWSAVMVKFATYGFAAALLGAAASANAESLTSTVQSIDAAQQTIMLDDGRSFALRPGLDTSQIAPGMAVTLNIEQIGDTELVTEIRAN